MEQVRKVPINYEIKSYYLKQQIKKCAMRSFSCLIQNSQMLAEGVGGISDVACDKIKSFITQIVNKVTFKKVSGMQHIYILSISFVSNHRPLRKVMSIFAIYLSVPMQPDVLCVK